MLDKIWKVLNSKLAILLIGFFLSGLVGTYINDKYQRATFQREKRFLILSKRIEDSSKFIEQISGRINKRFFGLQRILWVIEKGDLSKGKDIWQQYYSSVIEWNQNVNADYGKLIRLFGEEISKEYLDYQDEIRGNAPLSIHGKFYIIHKNTSNMLNMLERGQDIKEILNKTNEILSSLDIQSDTYIEILNMHVFQKAQELDEFANQPGAPDRKGRATFP